MHLTALLVPTLHHALTSMSGWLDKAAASRNRDADALLAHRLAQDMYPLSSQIRFAAFLAQEPLYRLRGLEIPKELEAVRAEGWNAGDRPDTMSAARTRIAEALATVATIRDDALDAGAGRPVSLSLPNGMIFDMSGDCYARDWALPQFYFHLTTAYAILRHAGVPLGKADYVPHMIAYLRPAAAPAG